MCAGGILSPQTLLQLFMAPLQHEWKNIPQCVVHCLIACMCCRCHAVIRVHGGHNQYTCVHVSGGFPEILFKDMYRIIPLPVASLSLVACIMSISFAFKLKKI